jgi:hypothetical protein
MAVENNLRLPICKMLGVSKENYWEVVCARFGKNLKMVYLKRYRTVPCNIKILLAMQQLTIGYMLAYHLLLRVTHNSDLNFGKASKKHHLYDYIFC